MQQYWKWTTILFCSTTIVDLILNASSSLTFHLEVKIDLQNQSTFVSSLIFVITYYSVFVQLLFILIIRTLNLEFPYPERLDILWSYQKRYTILYLVDLSWLFTMTHMVFNKYNAGVFSGNKFRNTKIPLYL